MVKKKKLNCLVLVIAILSLMPVLVSSQVITGAERTELYYPLLKNKTIGIVANNASVVNGKNIIDSLLAMGLEIKKIFAPEHGLRKSQEAGQTIKNTIDSATGIQVISLYGKKKKPDKYDLKDIDIVVFDLQDVGVRFFTYISTLTYVMESCAENNTPLLLFDRPNPNGFYVDGPVLDSTQASFVGLHPVPVVYGMTIGEYAQMINEEGWLKNRMICDLNIVSLENYTHSTPYQLPIKPSPNLSTMNAVYLYPSLCFFEGTIVSVGRGTDSPFEVFGHPAFKGFSFSFIPRRMVGMSLNPLYKDQDCLGVDLHDFYDTHPKMFGRINLSWLFMAYKNLGSQASFFNDYFDKLAGTSLLREQIIQNIPEIEIRKTWEPRLSEFKEIRKKYLLYPE